MKLNGMSMSLDKASLSAKSSNANIDDATNKSSNVMLKLPTNDSGLTPGIISPISTTMICASQQFNRPLLSATDASSL